MLHAGALAAFGIAAIDSSNLYVIDSVWAHRRMRHCWHSCVMDHSLRIVAIGGHRHRQRLDVMPSVHELHAHGSLRGACAIGDQAHAQQQSQQQRG